MELYLGKDRVIDLFLGLNHIEEMYKGNILIYSSNSTSPLPNPDPPLINPDIKISNYTNLEDGKDKIIYWTEGIIPPKVGRDLTKTGGGDFTRLYLPNSNDITYDTPYNPGHGWFDVKKSDEEILDDNLCFLAVAVNSLLWWIEKNKINIENYINKNNPSDPVIKKLNELVKGSKAQLGSSIWLHYLTKFGIRNTGYWPDPVQDNFINGYRFLIDLGEYNENIENNENGEDGKYLRQNGPDNIGNSNKKPMCGFFYDVFGIHRLSKRTPLNPENIENIDKIILESILKGEQLGITYYSRPNTYSTHIISIWGVEYNSDGTISALFICDNNDQPGSNGESMKRMIISKRNNLIYLTTKRDGSGGAQATTLTHLGQGKNYWNEWNKKNNIIN